VKTPVIPPKSNRKVQRAYDKELYKARHLMENFYCKLKQYRAIATRYDKTARTFSPQSISPPQSFGSIEDRL
jgi:transposase